MLGVSPFAVFIVVLICSYTVCAQEIQSDMKRLTDLRVGLVHAALQLTPEQEKYWPALEEAIRARSEPPHYLMRLPDDKYLAPDRYRRAGRSHLLGTGRFPLVWIICLMSEFNLLGSYRVR